MTYQFLAEAKRLWEIESTGSRVRLTTIQAAILLHLINVINAMDAVGSSYTQHAVTLAQRIGLFTFNPAGQSTKRSNAKLFTAWALYNWQMYDGCSLLSSAVLTF
jgi:dTDP-4-amino-4,6-dideoxygalactose transaminase